MNILKLFWGSAFCEFFIDMFSVQVDTDNSFLSELLFEP